MEHDNYELNAQLGIGHSTVRKPTLAMVSILFSAAVVLLLTIGFYAQKRWLYPGLLITEFGLILAPSLALLFIFRYDVKRVLRLNRVGIVNILLVICIMIFAMPVVAILNLANMSLINSIFGDVIVPDIPAAKSGLELLISVLIIGGSAGICEEVMFRGTIQRGFERFGAIKSILVTAFLFGLLHLDFQRFFGTFLLGALIGFIVYRTNSLYSGMIAHFANNSLAVLLSFLFTRMGDVMKSTGIKGTDAQQGIGGYFSYMASLSSFELFIVIMTWIVMLFVFGTILATFIYVFLRNTRECVENIRKDDNFVSKLGLLYLAPGLIFVIIRYIDIGRLLRG